MAFMNIINLQIIIIIIISSYATAGPNWRISVKICKSLMKVIQKQVPCV